MKKVIIKKINNYDYTLVDNEQNEFVVNIEFYSDYKPVVGDIIYFSDKIIINKNIYSFDEIYDLKKYDLDDMIKVVHDDKYYYFQRIYG